MTKIGVAWLGEEIASYRPRREVPRIPATDNGPGAVDALLKANRILRSRRWPAPYDRTRHEMVLGDACKLDFLPDESVHLVVTSPPYFNLKPYASEAAGRRTPPICSKGLPSWPMTRKPP